MLPNVLMTNQNVNIIWRYEMRKINIERIIRVNMPLMNRNVVMIQNVADCIIAYLIGALDEEKK